MPSTVTQLREFFLEAARQTYASAVGARLTVPELPGSKLFQYDCGELSYRDVYWTNGEFSGGVTLIWESGRPVWKMDYSGWCKDDNPEVVAFLKRVLLSTYQSGVFRGGRGPEERLESGMVYRNVVQEGYDGPWAFRKFGGLEHITTGGDGGKTCLFWHRYSGMLLLPYSPD